MGHWINIRLILWPLGIDKSMILIMKRHLNLLPKWLLYGLSWHLLRHKGGLSDKWTWKMLFYMGIWRKKSMSPPPGMFATPFLEVCRLRQSLYGLKQASHVWFDKFRSTLLGFHFTQSQFDSSLFLCKTSAGIVLLLVYVNDIVIIGSDAALLTQLQHLKASFHMNNLGPLQYFLGLEVQLTPTDILLHQHKYIEEVISLAGL